MRGSDLSTLSLANQPLDDRWTLSTLAAAGYTYHGAGACKSCGEPVEFYLRETLKGKGWLVLEAGSLAVHAVSCRR